MIEERLLAGPVTRQKQRPLARIPEREREHPVERLDRLVPALLVEVQDCLGVTLAAEPVPRLELLPQLAEVVDLPVEDEPQRAVLVRQRLVSRLAEVDDRQTAVP